MIVLLIIFVVLLVTVVKAISEKKYKQLESEVLNRRRSRLAGDSPETV